MHVYSDKSCPRQEDRPPNPALIWRKFRQSWQNSNSFFGRRVGGWEEEGRARSHFLSSFSPPPTQFFFVPSVHLLRGYSIQTNQKSLYAGRVILYSTAHAPCIIATSELTQAGGLKLCDKKLAWLRGWPYLFSSCANGSPHFYRNLENVSSPRRV